MCNVSINKLVSPQLFIKNNNIELVSRTRHLGIDINRKLRDGDGIIRMLRSVYCTANQGSGLELVRDSSIRCNMTRLELGLGLAKK